MHRYRIWVSIGIIWTILGWWGPAQETNKNIQEEPFAPVLEKPPAPIIKKMDSPFWQTTNAPALQKPPHPIFKKIGSPILKKTGTRLLTKPYAPDQEEREADVQEELDADAQEPLPLMPIPPGFTRIASDSESTEQMMRIKFEAMDLDEVLKLYSEWTGLALMKAPNVPAAKITLKCPKRLPKREALLAIESVLAMNGIALIPMGDTFLKVVPIAQARQDGMAIDTGPLDKHVEDTDRLVSQIVELKYIEIADAQTTVQSLLHSYGKIMPLEQVNCMLITDSALNIKRILEILKYLDQPMEIREELRIFHITYAKASEIQGKIEAIIADSQAKDPKTRFIRQQLAAARLPTRPLIPRRPGQPSRTIITKPSVVDISEPSERGLIQAKVKIVADDRTNVLIIITRPDQFQFLENMIKALDKQVEPDVTIKVFRLQYATASDVVSVLNSLISAVGTSTPSPVPPVPTAPVPTTVKTAKSSEEIQISGRLTADIKIIADTRINALLIMASRSDMKVVEDVIAKIDIMLSQVLIEVVIVEIGLSDEIQSGIDWLQRSMIAYNEKQSGEKRAFLSFAGTSKEGGSGEIKDATTISAIGDSTAAAGSGLTYYFTFFDYNLDAVINMLAQNSEARLLSTPIILTTDNTEARIMVGEKRPIVTSTSITSGGTQQSAYEYTDIGIELKVTPHINKKGFVVMDIEQKIENVGGYEVIDGNNVPIITTREFSASLSVDDGRTIVVGGLMSTDKVKTRSGIPFLSDIPFLGRLFRADYSDNNRRELLVMITPYVLDTPSKVYEETERRRGSVDHQATDMIVDGWTKSELIKSEPEEEEGKDESPEKEEK